MRWCATSITSVGLITVVLGCGDPIPQRQITITEDQGMNSGPWGPVPVDASRLPPGSVQGRVDGIDGDGNPVSTLKIFPNVPVKILIVPATQP